MFFSSCPYEGENAPATRKVRHTLSDVAVPPVNTQTQCHALGQGKNALSMEKHTILSHVVSDRLRIPSPDRAKIAVVLNARHGARRVIPSSQHLSGNVGE